MKFKNKFKITKKKSIIALISLLIIIPLAIFLWNFFTNDVFHAQLFDYNAEKNFEKVNNVMFTYENPEEAEEVIKENTDSIDMVGALYPLGDEGIYGENIDELDLEDFKMEKNEKNLQDVEMVNNQRNFYLAKLQKIITTVGIEEVKSEIKDDMLYKTVKITKPFEESKFRNIWYELSGRIFAKYKGIDWDWETSFWLKSYDGELINTKLAQHKALEILLENIEDFQSDDEYEFTMEYMNHDGQWVLTNYENYVLACMGFFTEENSPEESEEAIAQMYDNRSKMAEDYFNKYIKDLSNDEIFQLKMYK